MRQCKSILSGSMSIDKIHGYQLTFTITSFFYAETRVHIDFRECSALISNIGYFYP